MGTNSFKNRVILSICIWFIAYFFVFHEMLLSGFTSIPGDMFDTRFTLRLQEHWYQVLSAKASWLDLRIFYPKANTLGLSDAFFLFGLSHAFFRFCGLDIFNSYIANLTLISMVGYLGMLILLRSCLKLNWWVSYFYSFLFIASQSIHAPALASHTQFLTLWYCPWVLYFIFRFFQDFHNPTEKRITWAVLSGGCLALLFYNAFYFTWFMTFYLGITIPIFLTFLSLKKWRQDSDIRVEKQNQLIQPPRSHLMQNALQLGALFLSFAASLTPFLLTYIEVFHHYGGWDYPTVQNLLPHFTDFFHVRENNLIWGWTVQALCNADLLQPELDYGFSFGLLLLFLFSGLFLLVRKEWNFHRMLAITMVIGIVISWALLLQINGSSLWRLVFDFVPGGAAIRAPFRYNAFLILPAILTVAICTNDYMQIRKKENFRLTETTVILLLASIVTIEQWTTKENHPWRLNHNEIREKLERLPSPPDDIKCFYMQQNPSDQWRSNYLAEFNAFAVAQSIGIPTINGYSGKFPPGYELRKPMRHSTPDAYQKAVLDWLLKHEITNGVYCLDYENEQWQKTDNLLQTYANIHKIEARYHFGESIAFGQKGISNGDFSAENCIFSNFSAIEDDFTWTIGEHSQFLLFVENPPPSEITLKIYAYALVGPSHPKQSFIFSVNGEKLAELKYNIQNNEGWQEFKIPSHLFDRNAILVSIRSNNPAKPSDLETTEDSRLLGLAIHKIVLLR